MRNITQNEFYELSCDESKKRIYWTMKGFLKNMGVVPDFEKDWDETIENMEKPFKIYADLSELKTMPDDVKSANDQMQQKLMQN